MSVCVCVYVSMRERERERNTVQLSYAFAMKAIFAIFFYKNKKNAYSYMKLQNMIDTISL